MRLEPIDNTRLILSPKNKRVKKKKQEQKPSHDGSKMLDDLVSALVNLGYKKTESVKKAKEAMSHYSTLDECLKFALGT
jgi:Holliday junction resolvasome RuvABC DNA-binding subunit